MSHKATIRVGKNCNISLDAADPVELIKKSSQFTQLPRKCGHCQSDDLSFMHRTAGEGDEYSYLHLKCNASGCGAQCDIGQKKKPLGDIFFKFNPKDRKNVKDGFYKYWEQEGSNSGNSQNSNTGSSATSGTASSSAAVDDDDSDIPF